MGYNMYINNDGAGAMSIVINVKEKADLIWAIADKLTGAYKPLTNMEK